MKKVSQTTINNCFRKSGFVKTQSENEVINITENLSLHDVQIPDMSHSEFEAHVDVDSKAPVYGDVSDENLIIECSQKRQKNASEENNDAIQNPVPDFSIQQVSQALNLLSRFAIHEGCNTRR